MGEVDAARLDHGAAAGADLFQPAIARMDRHRALRDGQFHHRRAHADVESGADGAVARVRVSPVPPGSDAATIAAFLGVDASKVVVLSGEATAIMLDAAAAAPSKDDS